MAAETYGAWINGRPAAASELVPLAFAGFAHFTAMQVRGGKVRGFDLHLARLREASMALFGRALPDAEVEARIAAAIAAGPEDLSLTATVFSPKGEFTADSMEGELAVLVRTFAPSNGPKGPLRLAAVEYERPLAAIKHVGEIGKTLFLHEAKRQGFDDAAFYDRHERLSEATIWNLAFWDGEAVIWPKAPMLRGTTMGILQRQLQRSGIPQREEAVTLEKVRSFAGAAVMNSWTPGIAVTAIGPYALPEAGPFITLLHEAFGAEPLRDVG